MTRAPVDPQPARRGLRDWVWRQRLFLAVSLLLVARYGLTFTSQQGNELDVLATARQAADSAWLPEDWYLHQPAPHRTFFSAVVGPLLRVLPFETVAVLGRCLTFVLFAWGYPRLARTLGVEARWALAALLAFLPLQTLIAGEWMVAGFEPKPFAYICVVFGLDALLRRRWGSAFFLLGWGITCHVLVGLYATLCAAAVVLSDGRRLRSEMPGLLRAAPGFALASALGWWLILEQLRAPGGELARQASRILVRFRDPHHLLPSFWISHRHGVLSLTIVGLVTIGLAVVAVTHRDELRRRLAVLGIASSGLFVIGLACSVLEADGLLQYYWFRFPSVTLPFVALVLLALRLQSALSPRSHRLRGVLSGGVLLAAAATALTGLMASAASPRDLYTRSLDSQRVEAERWIRANTPREAVFLVDPFFDEFYVVAERARLVSFKHNPHSAESIVEWYGRLLRQNGGREPQKTGFGVRAELQRGFRQLSADDVRALACDYRLTHALVDAAFDPLSGIGSGALELHRNRGYVVYALDLASCSSRSPSNGRARGTLVQRDVGAT